MSLYDKASLVQIPSGTKDGTLYSVLPANGDGDFTHVRATSATRVNKDGLIESVASGVPRLDYPLLDGVVQSCPALLLEPLRRNIALHSGDINNAVWLKQRVTVTDNSVVSPDGNVSGDLIIGDGTGTSYFYDGFSVVSGTTYTISIFAKQADRKRFYINNFTSAGSIYFDLELGQIDTAATGTFSGGKIVYYGNGWYRCSVQFTATTTGNNNIGFVGDNYNGNMFYVWGAQIEDGGSGVDADYISSYTPTSGSTVTRNADECNSAGTTAEFNDSEGVLFAELKGLNETDSSTGYIVLNDGSTTTNAIFIQYRNTGELRLYNGGTSTPELIYRDASADLTENIKLAIKYGTTTGSYKIYINGFSQTLQGSFVATSMSGLSKLQFAYSNGTSNPFRGKAKQLMTFNEALTDSELEQVTSWTSFGEMAKGQLYTIE
jgi:hypothetical protein